jgi:hypothetical protein
MDFFRQDERNIPAEPTAIMAENIMAVLVLFIKS